MVRNILESWFVGDGDVCYEDVVDLYAWTLHNKRGDGLSDFFAVSGLYCVHSAPDRPPAL